MPEKKTKDPNRDGGTEGTTTGRGCRIRNHNLESKQSKFDQLKAARESGKKNKAEVHVERVWDEVTEEEYSAIVLQRQESDFLEHDGPEEAEYYDDGREIFDDDLHGDEESKYDKPQKTKKGKATEKAEIDKKKTVRSGDIRNMFAAANAKPKTKKDVELISLPVPSETLVSSLLDNLNGDFPDVRKPVSRSAVLFGSDTASSVEDVLAGREERNVFKRTIQKADQKVMRMKPKFEIPDFDFDSVPELDEQPAVRSKRPLPPSPFKSNLPEYIPTTVESLKEVAKVPKIKISLNDRSTYSAGKKIKQEINTGSSGFWDEDGDIDGMMASMSMPEDDNFELPKQEVTNQRLVSQWTVPDESKASVALGEMDTSTEDFSAVRTGPKSGLKLFWLDASEDFHRPGCVFLFGKIYEDGKFVSACVEITNIERRLFFLMRENMFDVDAEEELDDDVTVDDVATEFSAHARDLHIQRFKHKKSEFENYAFEKAEIPNKAKYVEVRYPFTSSNQFPEQFFVGKTYSHVFGSNTTALEIFLLERKLKGPSWLNIEGAIPNTPPISWCKKEYTVTGSANVSVIPNEHPPPVVIMAVQLRIVVNSRTKQNEIVAVAALVHQQFSLNKAAPKPAHTSHFLIVSHPSEAAFPFQFKDRAKAGSDSYNMEIAMNERALLSSFLAKVQMIDPDFLVFHDAIGYQLDILVNRAAALTVQNWSRLGRLKRKELPKGRNAAQVVVTGRLVCDVKRIAEELCPSKSYDLSELVREILKPNIPRQEVEGDMILEMYRSTEQLMSLLDSTLMDASYALSIMAELNALPLAVQITNIAGNILSRTLMGGRAERNEFLLLHAFTERKYICPDKTYRDFHHKKDNKRQTKRNGDEKTNSDLPKDELADAPDALAEEENPCDDVVVQLQTAGTGKRKPAYAGGLVLEPKKGLYDKYVLVMDFNSLYPSIIQEYNLCFTTIDRGLLVNYKGEDPLKYLPDPSAEPGVLPQEVKRLVESRREVKKLLKQPHLTADLRIQYDIRQKALKLIANSVYGCLGFQVFRFYQPLLAAQTTAKGREILTITKELIEEKMSLIVIYGDTDSIMIYTNSLDRDAVIKLGNNVKRETNKHYRCLELDIDGIFRTLLLLQKKKYAAMVETKLHDGTLTYVQQFKGLDMVRRDWSILSKKAGEFVVGEILSDKGRDIIIERIRAELQAICKRVHSEEYPLELYEITKQLTKDPSLYADVKGQPHVQVALRLNSSATATKKFRAGDTISYMICNEVPAGLTVPSGQRVPHTQRAYNIDEVRRGGLTIDKQYYLAEQVHKVVTRLCEPIEGLDSVVIADCLGVDRTQFPQHFSNPAEEETVGAVSDGELYRNCLPLIVTCPSCKDNWIFEEPFWEKSGKLSFSMLACPSCDEVPLIHEDQIKNALRIQIGLALQRYYKVKFICEDIGCHFGCSFVPPKFHHGLPVCPACDKAVLKPEYSDRDLYLQLCYWKNAFDPERTLEKLKKKVEHGTLALTLKNDLNLARSYVGLADYVQSFLSKSAYGRVDLRDFFHPSPAVYHDVQVKLEF